MEFFGITFFIVLIFPNNVQITPKLFIVWVIIVDGILEHSHCRNAVETSEIGVKHFTLGTLLSADLPKIKEVYQSVER